MEKKSFQELFDIDERVEVRINMTNACNLSCDFCDHDAHLPFDKNGSKIFRKKPLVSTPQALENLCEALVGVGEDDAHVLQGGEITVLPTPLVSHLIGIVHSYGRRVGMRTNGYNLTGIPLESLNKLDFIYLNAHGNNEEAIEYSREFLQKNYDGRIIDENHYSHRDLSAYLNHNEGTIEEGLSCNHLLATLTFFPPIVHPCCNSWPLMNVMNSTNMADLLIAAGWTSDNPDLIDTLANWRETLPKPFLQKFCAESCYLTAKETNSPWYKIKSYPKDRVLKK